MNKVKEMLRRLTTARALVLGLFFAAIYYYFVYDDGTNLNRQITTAQGEIVTQGKKVKELNEQLDRAQEYQRSAAEMGEALNRLLSYIPEDFREQDFMKLVSEEAKIAGLNIVRITEVAPAANSVEAEKKAGFEELVVTVDFQGSFAQQMTFLANLTKRKQIFVVDKFNMTKQGTGPLATDLPVLSFKADIKAYRYAGSKPKS